MNDRERITRLEIRCEQLQLTVNEAFHWIDVLKSDLSDLQDRVGQADRKTEPQTEVDWKDQMWAEAVEASKDEPQTDCYVSDLCKHYGDKQICGRCRNRNLFAEADTEPKPKTEPQTHCDNCMYLHCNYECAGEIVHKMIDDAVIAEDDYPDLKQRMHDAVDEYEPQTERRCGTCKHLTYRWNKTWCDIKCENPHDVVCDKWAERSE